MVSFYQNAFNGKTNVALDTIDTSGLESRRVKEIRDNIEYGIKSSKEDGIKDFKIVSKGVTYNSNKDEATVKLETSFKRSNEDTKTRNVDINLVKVKGKWKISNRYF